MDIHTGGSARHEINHDTEGEAQVSADLETIVAERLPHNIQPENWDHWRIQIQQMIPRGVNLSRHILYDWSPELDPSLPSVDIYVYDIKNDSLKPLVRIQNPDLSFSRRMEDSVAVVDEVLANIVRDASSNGHRLVGIGQIVVYKNKQIQSPKMFGPTIDTLMMSAALERHMKLAGDNHIVLEVGTGNGMISKTILAGHHSQLQKLFATDLSGIVLKEATQNILSLDIAEEQKDKLVTVRDPTFLQNVTEGSLSYIVSNPPYIPDFRSEGDGQLHHAITGLEVYGAILGEWGYRALRDSGSAVVILSSVSAAQIRDMVEEQELFSEHQVLTKKMVPFDLADVNLDSAYLEQLIDKKCVYMLNGRLFHLVEVVEFKKSKA